MKSNILRFLLIFILAFMVIGLLVGASKAVLSNADGSDTTIKSDVITDPSFDETDEDPSELPDDDISDLPDDNGCVHSFDNGVVKQEPTCKASGLRVRTCSKCSITKQETIPKLTDHTYDEGVVTLEATCSKVGKKTKTCLTCGFKMDEVIPKTTKHAFNVSGVCKECGSTCSHKWTDYVASIIDVNQHIRECFYCELKQTGTHNYIDGVCKVCGSECSHSSYTIVDNTDYEYYDEDQHSYKWLVECDTCKYRYKFDDGNVSDHVFVNGYCDLCGYGNPDLCIHDYNGWEWRDINPVSSLGNAQHQISYVLVCYHCSTILDTREEIEGCGYYNGYCPSCGYCWDSGDGDYDEGNSSCSHSNTSTSGDVCWEFTYCLDCGENIGSPIHSGFQDSNGDYVCDHCGEY